MGSPPQSLSDAIRRITAEPDEEVGLRRVVAVALQEIDAADYAGVTVLTKRAVQTHAASDGLVEKIDREQYDAWEGPCVTAAVENLTVVHADDLRHDERWPTFGPRAAALNVNSMLCFKLFHGEASLGALNLYAHAPYAFPDDAANVGALLAAHAAVVMSAARKQANLSVALESRDVIGQAKGILMERYKLDDRQAFDVLIAASQHTHRKLREIADELRTTGELVGFR